MSTATLIMTEVLAPELGLVPLPLCTRPHPERPVPEGHPALVPTELQVFC